jgi:hypothetical protein
MSSNTRHLMGRVLAAAVVVGGVMVGSASAASAVPVITATATAGLVEGRVVTVSGTGLPADTSLQVGQFRSDATGTSGCQSPGSSTTTSASGSFSVSLTVHVVINPSPGTRDGRTAGCGIGAIWSGGSAYVPTTLRFASLSYPPTTNLHDGDQATITASGYASGASVIVGQRVAGATSASQCDTSTASLPTANGAGTATTTMIVWSTITTGSGSTNCWSGGCAIQFLASAPLSF